MRTTRSTKMALAAIAVTLGGALGSTYRGAAGAALAPAMPPPQAHSEGAIDTGFIRLYPVVDARVSSGAPSQNFGAANWLAVGEWGSDAASAIKEEVAALGDNVNRTLMGFGLSAIPPGGRILQARLYLYVIGYYDRGPSINQVALWRVQGAWNEGSVTWNNHPPHVGARYSLASVPDMFGWVDWTATELVRDWYEGTYPNHGLILISVDEDTEAHRQFSGREGAYSPKLEVSYELPTSTPTRTPTASRTATRTRTPTRTVSPTRTPTLKQPRSPTPTPTRTPTRTRAPTRTSPPATLWRLWAPVAPLGER